MNRIAIAALFAATLSACASTREVLDEPPTQVIYSSKSQNEVAFCLGNKNSVPVLEQADGSKVILYKNGYGAVSLAFSVYSDPKGSRIEYRRKFGTIGAIWRQCVGLKEED